MSEKKRKAVSVELIDEYPEDDKGRPGPQRAVYRILDELVAEHHQHLDEMSVVILWKFGWKADEDGRMKVAEAKRTNDTDRELRHDGRDVVVYLNHGVFNNGRFTEHQMRFWLDHALTGIAPKYDSEGEHVVNEKGDTIFRTRKPDVQVFSEVVARHGILIDELVTLRNVFDNPTNRERDDSLIAWAEAQAGEHSEPEEIEEPAEPAAI
jgi:hypothetical protein